MPLSLYQKAKSYFTSKKSSANFSRRIFSIGQRGLSERQNSEDDDMQVPKNKNFVERINLFLGFFLFKSC